MSRLEEVREIISRVEADVQKIIVRTQDCATKNDIDALYEFWNGFLGFKRTAQRLAEKIDKKGEVIEVRANG